MDSGSARANAPTAADIRGTAGLTRTGDAQAVCDKRTNGALTACFIH